jgi:hypothetical protein
MRFLPLKIHNALDFIVGIALILSPYIFGFSDVGGAAVAVPQIIGAASIFMGLFTRGYGFSIAKLIPLKTHLTIDFLAGATLAASPWLFGFADEETNAWLPHVVVGLALVLVSLTTRMDDQTAADSGQAARA